MILCGILLLSLALRSPYLFQESVWNDETVYMWIGSRISQNFAFLLTPYPAFHSYGYLFDIVIAFFSALLKDPFVASRIAVLFFSLLGIAVVFFALERSLGIEAAITGALLLAFNPVYSFISCRSLLDVPLAAVTALLGFSFLLNSPPITGAIIALLPFTKVAGIVPASIGYLFLIEDALRAWREGKGVKKYVKGLAVASIGLLLFFTLNYVFFGSPFRPGGARIGPGSIFTGSRFYYVENAGIVYGSFIILLLALIGGYFSLENKPFFRIFSVFLIYFLFFSLFVGEMVPRYILPTVPLAIMLAMFGGIKLIEKAGGNRKIVLLLLLLLPLELNTSLGLLNAKKYTYTGFQELGEKVAELDKIYNFSTVYAQSMRQIRAFSGIEYKSNGGKISPLPKKLEELANKTNILLQLDIWEYTAPEWAYPLTQEKLNRILALNFSVVHVVYREYPSQQGVQKVPVGMLLDK